MKHSEKISIPMPDLPPEIAYLLTDWVSRVVHEIDMYYGDQVRSYVELSDREEMEAEQEIYNLRECDVPQIEIIF